MLTPHVLIMLIERLSNMSNATMLHCETSYFYVNYLIDQILHFYVLWVSRNTFRIKSCLALARKPAVPTINSYLQTGYESFIPKETYKAFSTDIILRK